MKPKPHSTVHELLTRDDKPPHLILPYDTYPSDKAGFLTVALRGEFLAIPLLALTKASLREGAASIVLEFGTLIVQIDGKALEELFESILLGRIRVIRTGKHPSCSINAIRVSETALPSLI